LKQDGTSSEVLSEAVFALNQPLRFYAEGISGSKQFKDTLLKIEYVPVDQAKASGDRAQVTVFEVTQQGFFGGEGGVAAAQHTDNNARLSNPNIDASSDKTGIISWNDANGDGKIGDLDNHCVSFHNSMENQGTVLPPPPPQATTQPTTNPARPAYPVEFRYYQQKWGGIWSDYLRNGKVQTWVENNAADGLQFFLPWTDDRAIPAARDETPSVQGHIYQLDAPGFHEAVVPPVQLQNPQGFRLLQRKMVVNLRDWVVVVLYGKQFVCSESMAAGPVAKAKPPVAVKAKVAGKGKMREGKGKALTPTLSRRAREN
jgi:hypothetical protein